MSLLRKLRLVRRIVACRGVLLRALRSYLFFLDHPEKSAWGSITDEDEAGIRLAVELARRHKGPIVEIGALFGHTTNLLASIKPDEVPLVAVENFVWNPFGLPRDAHRQFLRRTLRYALDHCSTSIFEGSAEEFYAVNKTLRPSLVFIDAGHAYESVKRDIEWAASAGCPVISGHDYVGAHPGVVKAVDEAFGGGIVLRGSVWIHVASA